jgi:RimJ/RimL family protein N-acetyltransferase
MQTWIPIDLQAHSIFLRLLHAADFESLYAVASDPLIWVQHPNPDRWKRAVFSTYFEGALLSGRAYLIIHGQTGEVMGCTRYYDLDDSQRSIKIGYTFFGRKWWGGGHNPWVKALMLDHAFHYVDQVLFEVGEHNKRSITAMQRIGGVQISSRPIAYYGEAPKTNLIFLINKDRFYLSQLWFDFQNML